MNSKKARLPALVVMTRWAAINRCKKRLSNEIGSKQATIIQRELIEHTFKVVESIGKKKLAEIFVAVSGISKQSATRWVKSKGLINTINQGEGSLGLRMRKQFLRMQRYKRKRKTILIGSDLPTLCERDVIEAIDSLNKFPIVLGPSKDGGYWLIGMSGELLDPLVIWPFSNIPWGTDKVLEETLKSAKLTNTNYFLLHEHNDLDTLNDLSPWLNEF